MKRLLLFAFALTPLACGGAEPTAQPPPTPSAAPVTVDVAAAPKSTEEKSADASSEDTNDPGAPKGNMVGGDAEVGGLGLRGSAIGGVGGIGSRGFADGTKGDGIPAATMRVGVANVQGRLPPEIIQRVVRARYGRFRACYANGLRADPKFEGKVTVKFVIATDGSVSQVTTGDTTLPNKNIVACITSGFRDLAFPAPEGGTVSVVYPIVFKLADASKKPAN